MSCVRWDIQARSDIPPKDPQCVQEKERQVRAAYIEAEALVKRCLNASHRTWNDLARQLLRTRRPGSGFSAGLPRRMSSGNRQASLSDAPLGGARLLCCSHFQSGCGIGVIPAVCSCLDACGQSLMSDAVQYRCLKQASIVHSILLTCM